MHYFNRPRWRIITLCALAVIALPLLGRPLLRHMQAQTAAAIQYGETVKGTLAADAVQDWSFVASSGDQVSVMLVRTSGDLRASLTLQDQDQLPLVSVQASSDGQIALSAIRIGQPGAYTLHVQSTAATSGAYTLTLANTATPDATTTPLPPGTSGEITNGATVHGALSNQVYEQFWHFKGAVGDVIDLQMHATSGTLVAYISLLSPGAQVVTTAAGINGKQDAGIFSQQLIQAGTYTIIARRAGDQQGKTGQTSGAYDLTLTVHTVAPGVTNTILALNATISGRLSTTSPVSQYQIESGGVIALQLALASTHRIARVRILDGSSSVLSTHEGSSPLAFSLTLPDKGPFYVQVSSDTFDDQKSVDFALSAFKIRALAQPLRFFETQHGSAGSADEHWFFTAHAGDLVRLNVTPAVGLLNTGVVISGPQDVLLFQGNIGPRFDQPFTLPAAGLYQVTVQSGVQNATPSDYTINASWFGARGVPFERFGVSQSKGALDLDTPVTATLSTDGGDTWAFDATADQAITVSVSGQAAVQSLGVAVRAPDDTLLGVQYGSGSVFLPNVLLPRLGRYHLIVFDPSGASNNTYTLQVENSGGGILPVGQPVKGVLLPTNALAAWTLDVPAGALINAQLTTRTPIAWTPGLYILDPSGIALTRTTISAEKDQVALLGVSAPVAGRYQIIVAGTVAAAFASYELRANVQVPFASGANSGVNSQSSQTSLPPVTRFAPASDPSTASPTLADLIEPSLPAEKFSAPDVQLLPPNTLMRGEIALGALRQVWHILGQTGTTLAIRAVALSSDNGPDLLLLDRQGRILVQQLHGDTTDTNLTYRVVQAGDYTLSVRMGLNSGRYTLYAQAQILKTGALSIAAGTPIVYGQSISGEIRSADQSDTYYFYGADNDVIGVQTVRTVGDLVPSLQIVTPTGTALAVDSNKAAGALSTLQNVRLPQEGIYAVIVRHSDATTQTTGRYLLALQVISGSRLKNRLSGILSPGQTVSGALLVTDNTNTWLIKGRAGQRVSLVASALQRGAEPTPLGLRLMDTTGTTFASQDVFLPQDSARLTDVMLPADGIYRVQVIGGGQTSGGYQLTWLSEREPMLPGALRYGQTVGGVFTATHNADTWVFAGTANDVISISLSDVRGTLFRGGFQILSANGVALATAADLGDGSGARVDNLLLPFTGSYRLIIANSDSAFQGAGVYALSLVLQDSKARALGAILHDGEQGTSDLYPDTPAATWLFSGHSGDVVNVRLEARDQFLKPMLTLQNAFGQVLTTASASTSAPGATLSGATLSGTTLSGTTLSGAAVINAFKLPADGVYALLVNGMDKSTGSYRIGLDFVPPPATTVDTLQYGANVVGLVANDRPEDVHLFNGKQGDHVSAKVTREPGSQLATVLELRTLQGDTLIRSDALGQDNAVIDDFVLPTTGTYRLVTTRYLGVQGITTGRFTLTLNGRTPPVPIRGKLIPGQKGVGRLNDATPADHWTFDGKASEVISITSKATSGDLDTFLTLQAPDGSVIATNDDFDGTNAVLSGVTLPVDGLYSITLSRVGTGTRGSSGNYELRADDLYTLGLGQSSTPQALITYGQRVVGTLDPANTETRWTFSGNQGDVISIQIAHPTDDTPPLLSLQDPTGAALATGQLGIGQTTIDGYRLPARGFFDVVVKRPLNLQTAYTPYALTLILDSSTASSAAQSGTLQANGVVIGSLSDGQSASLWLLSGSAGQTFSLELLNLTGNLTPSVLLVDPGGQALVTRTLAASESTLRFDNVPLALSGIYTVIVVPGATDQSGTYRLTTRSTLNDTPTAHALAPDQNVQSTLDDIHPAESWQIQARKGQLINVQMLAMSGELQPSVQIVSSDGQILAVGHLDRTLVGNVSAISAFAFPADGTYQLVATRSATGGAAGSGTYALTYSTTPLTVQTLLAAPIHYGQTVQNVVPASQNGLWLFDGKAGDAVNLIVQPVPLLGTVTNAVGNATPSATASAPNSVPALTLQDAGGQLLAHANPSGAETDIQGFVLPGDGRYVVTLAAGQTVPYLLTLQRRQDVLPASPSGRILVNGVTQQNGILDKNLYDYWLLSGKADSVIQIAATQGAGNLRMDLTLYGPNGYLASSTADAATHALTLGPLRLPTSGTYQVVVGRWLGASGKTTGRYSLLLSDVSGTALPPTVAPITMKAIPTNFADQSNTPEIAPGMVNQGEIAPGSNAQGVLNALQVGHAWTFNAQTSPTIAVMLQSESAGLQVKALIIDANGSLIGKAQSDTTGALLLEAPLPAPGRYTLLIMPGTPGQSGAYHFQLGYALSPTGGGRLVSDETVTGTVTATDFTDSWHFTVSKGALITAQAARQSGNLDLELTLIDPSGVQLVTLDSGTLPAMIAPHDGTYQVIVTRQGGAVGTTSGAYQLRVSLRTPTF